MSGVIVPSTSRSTSDGSQPAAFRQRDAACEQRSLVAWWGAANRLSWIPVRATIHSGSKPWEMRRSSFVTTCSGTELPVARICTPVKIRFLGSTCGGPLLMGESETVEGETNARRVAVPRRFGASRGVLRR